MLSDERTYLKVAKEQINISVIRPWTRERKSEIRVKTALIMFPLERNELVVNREITRNFFLKIRQIPSRE